MTKRILQVAGVLLLVTLIGLAGFLGWRVMDARAKTAVLVAAWVAMAGPEIRNLPKARLDQYLAVEDPTFWTNDGVDLKSPGAGQTTTTQGLGKVLYFKSFRKGYWRKLQLIAMSKYALTAKASKQDILTAALTASHLSHGVTGRPVVGFSSAAMVYFGKPLSQLSDDEWLSLVAMQVGPDGMNPLTHPDRNAERVGRIKRLLAGICKPSGVNDVMLEGCKAA